MIPVVSDDLQRNFTFQEQPSKTYALNATSGTISGFISELEAMKQAVFLILNTERYEHLIYSWNYGVELLDLFGEPISFVIPEVKRKIQEALLQDSRIMAVDDFVIESKKESVQVNFTVSTIFGNLKAEKVVTI